MPPQRDAAWVQSLTTYVTQPVGQMFLRLLFMLVMPLLFSALVVGMAEMGDIRALGRIGLQDARLHRRRLGDRGRARPGPGQPVQARRRRRSGAGASRCSPMRAERARRHRQGRRRQPRGHRHAVRQIVPNNLVEAAAEQRHPGGDVLRADVRHRPGADRQPSQRTQLQRGIEGLFDVTMTLIGLVIRAGADRGRLLHVQPGRAVRLGPAGAPGRLCRRGAAGARDPHVRRLPAVGEVRSAAEPDRVLPRASRRRW